MLRSEPGLGRKLVQGPRTGLVVTQEASRVSLAGRSSKVPAGWADRATQGTQLQTEARWAKYCLPVGQSQRAGSCHTERQNTEKEEEKMEEMERQTGQGPEPRNGEERGWRGWRTPTGSCKHGRLT